MNAHVFARCFRETHNELRASVLGECFTLLSEDAEASAIARKLRGFSDHDLAWFEFISAPNMALICARLRTTPHVLMLARQYESCRRRVYPYHEIAGMSSATGAPQQVAESRTRPPIPEIGIHAGASALLRLPLEASRVLPPNACEADLSQIGAAPSVGRPPGHALQGAGSAVTELSEGEAA